MSLKYCACQTTEKATDELFKKVTIMKKSIIIYSIVLVTIVFAAAVLGQNTSSDRRLKKRIAVFDFDDKTNHAYHWWTGQPVGEGMADMLVTALVKTGNYQVFERQEIQKIMGEQQLGQTGAVTQESAAQVGKLLGVELAIIGAVTEFGYSQGTIGGALKQKGLGLGVKSTKATVAVDVRFVNTTTGEIITAESVRKEESKKGLSVNTNQIDYENQNAFDESIVGKATRQAIDAIVEFVNSTAPDLPWQAKIIKGDGPIFINVGAVAGVQIGDEFVVYHAGEELIDPDTGVSLGAVETKVGSIKVTNNNIGNGKASQCTAVQGSGFQKNDLVRLQ
jgi:curli biogenesis system outer membrane secretion channel CsgG